MGSFLDRANANRHDKALELLKKWGLETKALADADGVVRSWFIGPEENFMGGVPKVCTEEQMVNGPKPRYLQFIELRSSEHDALMWVLENSELFREVTLMHVPASFVSENLCMEAVQKAHKESSPEKRSGLFGVVGSWFERPDVLEDLDAVRRNGTALRFVPEGMKTRNPCLDDVKQGAEDETPSPDGPKPGM